MCKTVLQSRKKWFYYCSRAGKYESQGKCNGSSKSQGTSKVISHCTAHIYATVNIQTRAVRVRYNSTPFNHDTHLGHLRISNATRTMIASKLQQGITTQRILDDIRDPEQGKQIGREHLVSRKDINNIRIQFIIEGISGTKMTL